MLAFALFFMALASLGGCTSAEQRAQNYYDHGQQLLADGQLDKAALEFRNALKLKDDMVPAMFALGQIAEQKGDYPVGDGELPQRGRARHQACRCAGQARRASCLPASSWTRPRNTPTKPMRWRQPIPMCWRSRRRWRSISAIPPAQSISRSRRSKPSRASSTRCWSSPPNACVPAMPKARWRCSIRPPTRANTTSPFSSSS